MCKFCGDIDCRNLILAAKEQQQQKEQQNKDMCRKAKRMFALRLRAQQQEQL